MTFFLTQIFYDGYLQFEMKTNYIFTRDNQGKYLDNLVIFRVTNNQFSRDIFISHQVGV